MCNHSKSEDEGMLYKVLKGKHSLSVAIMNGIVNQRQLDFPLLLGYLLSLPVEVSCSLLKDLEKR